MIATFIILSLLVANLAIALVKHGESKGEFNFWVELLAVAISLVLYYYAGLFDKFSILL